MVVTVEVLNHGLKRILERTVGENLASWSDKLDDALWAFCTAFKTPIGCTPYKLVYGKACHLPIELEDKACWVLKHFNFDLKSAGDHQKVQMNELNELRDQAYENSLIYKEKTMKIHDSKIKNRVFNIGDRVLLFNFRLKILSGKLKTRWTGPFTATQGFPYGTSLSQTITKLRLGFLGIYIPSPVPQIPSPPLPVPPPVPVLPASPPASPIRPLGYRAAMIRLRAEAASTSHSLPLPPPIILSHTRPVAPLSGTSPLHLLSIDHREDKPEVCLPPRKRLCSTQGPRYEIRESSAVAAARPIGGRRANYGFVDPREAVEEVASITLEGVNTRMTELATVQEQDMQDIYDVIGDTQDRQTQIYQRVETLVDDSQYHYETARLLDQEALVSREAWGRSIEVSYMTRSEIMALRSVVMGQQAVIS
ncbi:reverse transcriptase domain-containing protein [Tanacetum coccineum]